MDLANEIAFHRGLGNKHMNPRDFAREQEAFHQSQFYSKPTNLFRAEVREQLTHLAPYLRELLLAEGIDVTKISPRIGIAETLFAPSNSMANRSCKSAKRRGVALFAKNRHRERGNA